MQAIRDLERKESMEDLFFGQVAIIWARWFLIFTGGLLVLWNATTLNSLTLGVIPVALLMGMNFYLHGCYLMEKPVGAQFVLLTAVLDVVIISAFVLVSAPAGGAVTADDGTVIGAVLGGPLHTEMFVMYYPMVLAFAFVMPRKVEVAYTVLVCVAYGLLALLSVVAHDAPNVSAFVEAQGEAKLLAIRILTIAAMGGLGNYYFRIMRRRRAQEPLAA